MSFGVSAKSMEMIINALAEKEIKKASILPLPYYFDVVHYESLKHSGLKEHIDKFGKIFYKRSEVQKDTYINKP